MASERADTCHPCPHTALYPPSHQQSLSVLSLSSSLRPVLWRSHGVSIGVFDQSDQLPGHGHRGHPVALRDDSVIMQGDYPRYAAGPSLLVADAMGAL